VIKKGKRPKKGKFVVRGEKKKRIAWFTKEKDSEYPTVDKKGEKKSVEGGKRKKNV